jgi:hypothetical protein
MLHHHITTCDPIRVPVVPASRILYAESFFGLPQQQPHRILYKALVPATRILCAD